MIHNVNDSRAYRGETRPMRRVITCGPTFFCNVPTFLSGKGPMGPSFEISRMIG